MDQDGLAETQASVLFLIHLFKAKPSAEKVSRRDYKFHFRTISTEQNHSIMMQSCVWRPSGIGQRLAEDLSKANSVSSHHMRCSTTENRRAGAILHCDVPAACSVRHPVCKLLVTLEIRNLGRCHQRGGHGSAIKNAHARILELPWAPIRPSVKRSCVGANAA